jgi:hypothetical protein
MAAQDPAIIEREHLQNLLPTNLSGTTITDKHELERGSLLVSHLGDVRPDEKLM